VANYPSSLDVLANPTGGQVQGSTAPTHSVHHANANDILEALEAKLGIGASTPVANTVLRGTGTGVTAFGAIATADLTAGAISQYAKATMTTSSPTSTATSPVLIPEMTVTIAAVGGGILAVFYEGIFQHNTAATVTALDLYVGGGQVSRREYTAALANASTHVGGFYFAASVAGSITAELRWFTTTGTMLTVQGQRALTIMELKR
jgi:hypothetical protein